MCSRASAGRGVAVNHSAGEVVICDNLFINFLTAAINASSYRADFLPAKHITVGGTTLI